MFIVLGSLIVLVCAAWSAHTAWFASHAIKVSGQILVVGEEARDPEGCIRYVVFSFLDASGVVHIQRTNTDGGLSQNQKVCILYNPADPEDSTISSTHSGGGSRSLRLSA